MGLCRKGKTPSGKIAPGPYDSGTDGFPIDGKYPAYRNRFFIGTGTRTSVPSQRRDATATVAFCSRRSAGHTGSGDTGMPTSPVRQIRMVDDGQIRKG